MTATERIIDLITSRLLESGAWSISTEELEDLADPVDLYRAVYELKLIDRDVFDQNSAGELLTLLERVVADDMEQRLRVAGLFLNHEDRIELTELFVRRLQQMLVLHLPQPEMFRGMISQFRGFDRAVDAYVEAYLDVDSVVQQTATEYSDRSRYDGRRAALLTAAWYLETLLGRRIVVLRELAPALFGLLMEVARQEGALPRPTGRASGDDEPDNRESGRDPRPGLRAALKLLGLSGESASRATVRRKYRQLMRKHHPDVNPNGLEMAKKLNAAYAFILTNGDPD